ncbi:MAG: EamA family transporter [Alphaproteobacteria bacterium]|nr:EamA family transporter [Alphaproteobacteria bacterium]
MGMFTTGSEVDDPSTRNALPYAMIVVAAMILASNHIIARYLNGVIPPIGLVFWRMVIGSIILLPFATRGVLAHRQLIRTHWKLFLVMACLFVPLGNGLIYAGYNFTTALNGGVVSTAQPALTVLLSWLLFRDLINLKQGTGIFIAALGVVFIITRGVPINLLTLQPNIGDLLILLATVFVALHNVLLRRVPKQISTFSFMLVIQLVGAAITLPLYVAESIFLRPVPVNLVTIATLLWVGIAITTVAVGLTNTAVRLIGANKASLGNYIRSLFTAFLAIVLLGEELHLFHAIALVLVLSGVYLMTRGRVSVRIVTAK